jgi:hypothetical protein
VFFNPLLLQAISAFFFRFGRLPAAYNGTHAHRGFHMVAEAIERRASAIVGVNFHFNRPSSFMAEIEATNTVDFTPDELNRCFGNGFTYHRESNTLYIRGSRVLPAFGRAGTRSRVNNGVPYNSLIGPARYPVQSNGAGGDLLIVDMQT